MAVGVGVAVGAVSSVSSVHPYRPLAHNRSCQQELWEACWPCTRHRDEGSEV